MACQVCGHRRFWLRGSGGTVVCAWLVWPACLGWRLQQRPTQCISCKCVPLFGRLALEDRLAALVRHLDSSWLGPWRRVQNPVSLLTNLVTSFALCGLLVSLLAVGGPDCPNMSARVTYRALPLIPALPIPQVPAAGRAAVRRQPSWRGSGLPLAGASGGSRPAGHPSAGGRAAPCCGSAGTTRPHSSQQRRCWHVS